MMGARSKDLLHPFRVHGFVFLAVISALAAGCSSRTRKDPDKPLRVCVQAANQKSFACLDYCKVVPFVYKDGCEKTCLAEHEADLDRCGLK